MSFINACIIIKYETMHGSADTNTKVDLLKLSLSVNRLRMYIAHTDNT